MVDTFAAHRIAGLDGIRAIAALLVFSTHAKIGIVGGGFGVDLFFVLSGYLITGRLVEELETTGSISIGRFYARRAIRLVPALVVMCAITACLYAWIYPDTASLFIAQEVLPSLFYVSDYTKAFLGYPRTSFFGHTWSLAIEEQFYLIWPFVIVLLIPGSPRKKLAIVLGSVAACVLWRLYLFQSGASAPRIYNAFDTRADGLLVGSALALTSLEVQRVIAKVWLPALIFILYMVGFKSWGFPSTYKHGALLLAVCTAVVIAKIVSDQQSKLVRVLSLQPLPAIGLTSYAFYLWHAPVLAFLKPAMGNDWLYVVVSLCLTLLISTVSWLLVERPITLLFQRHHRQVRPLIEPG